MTTQSGILLRSAVNLSATQIQSSRREAQPNPGFLRQLQKFEAQLQKKRGSFFNARNVSSAVGKKNDENVQQNTPRTQVAFSEGQGADTRAVAYRPEQNMRMSFNEARADQNDHGETALQTFWKRNMSSNKSKSTSGTSAATPVASIQHPSSRTATAGALIRRPEPLSARHVQNGWTGSSNGYHVGAPHYGHGGYEHGAQHFHHGHSSHAHGAQHGHTSAHFGAGRSVGGGRLIQAGGGGNLQVPGPAVGTPQRSSPALIRRQ
eukprot:Tamp_11199.p2 GENE.Tamp_11199~~Tamp_11199.p2  ORF type:complete len:263 (-),score=17.75 Tamp_11199:271-1059(-)